MEVSITYRELEHKQEYKKNIQERVLKLDRKFKLKIKDIAVILEQKKYHFFAEVLIRAKDLKVVGQGKSDKNIFVAIDEAMSKADVQLKKHKEKVKLHKTKKLSKEERSLASELNPQEEAALEETESKSMAVPRFKIEIKRLIQLRPEDAALFMESVPTDPFLVFENAVSGKVNVIYRKENGTYSVIQQGK